MIWFKTYTLEDLALLNKAQGLASLLNISLCILGPDYLVASMPVNSNLYQIHGILHGGATCVLVETVASVAAHLCLDTSVQSAVGSVINVNHLRPVKGGMLIATAKPVHVGRQKHVWDIMVVAQDSDKLIAKGELTCAIIARDT